MSTLPLRVEDITPAWLDAALSRWMPGIRVAAVEEMHVLHGTATKIRLRLRYEEDVPHGPPTQLCVKGGFNEELRPLVAPAYCLEAEFYAHIGRHSSLDLPLPRCWFAAAEPERSQGIVILDDLVSAGARFGDPTEAWSVAQVEAGLDVLARLHGPTWGATRADYPWLPAVCPLRVPTPWLYAAENWQRTLAESFADLIPTSLRDPDRLCRAQFRMWEADDAGVHCLDHMDPHVGNTYFDAEGQPRFIDWQCVYLSAAVDDVAYFMSGALSVEGRRRHETELLRGYLDALHRCGGPKLDFDAFWIDYRKHLIHGFLWVVTPASMQSPARVAAMAERHIAAMLDHDTLALIERG